MIVRALELYNARYGNFPNEQGSSWETSTTYPTTFLNELVASGTVNAVPVDRRLIPPPEDIIGIIFTLRGAMVAMYLVVISLYYKL